MGDESASTSRRGDTSVSTELVEEEIVTRGRVLDTLEAQACAGVEA